MVLDGSIITEIPFTAEYGRYTRTEAGMYTCCSSVWHVLGAFCWNLLTNKKL